MTVADRVAALLREKPHLGAGAIARILGIPVGHITRAARSRGIELPDGRKVGAACGLPDLHVPDIGP